MSKNNTTTNKAAIKNGTILAVFALISTGLIAITHLVTKDKIADEIEAAMTKRLDNIIPKEKYDNLAHQDCRFVNDKTLLGSESDLKVYRMRHQNKNFAVFMTSVAPDGYSGKIKLVIGIYNNGKIAGVRVTEHQETPGLGDQIEIEKSDWIKQFNNLSIHDTPKKDWQVIKDGGQFDALTGATITSRAIIKSVYNTLIYFDKNKQTIFDSSKNCEVSK